MLAKSFNLNEFNCFHFFSTQRKKDKHSSQEHILKTRTYPGSHDWEGIKKFSFFGKDIKEAAGRSDRLVVRTEKEHEEWNILFGEKLGKVKILHSSSSRNETLNEIKFYGCGSCGSWKLENVLKKVSLVLHQPRSWLERVKIPKYFRLNEINTIMASLHSPHPSLSRRVSQTSLHFFSLS